MNSKRHTHFDLVIIGGGIAGAGIARDAAMRGLRVALFEQATFGSGTSSKSSKLIHGGLRYLELAWIALKKRRVREAWKNFRFVLSSLRESRVLESIAPGLVRPIELVIPIYLRRERSTFSVYFGTVFYGFLSLLAGNRRLPKIFRTKSAILNVLPSLQKHGLVGGVAIWDHMTNDKELVNATIKAAVKNGAECHEHAGVEDYRYRPENQNYEVTVRRNGKSESVFARKLVNASGPWIDKLKTKANEQGENYLVPVAGSHIMLPKFLDHSVILEAPDRRIFFVINIGDYARVGTTEWIHKDPDRLETPDEDVEYLLCALERYFPRDQFQFEDVIDKDSGIRPLAKPRRAAEPHAVSREHQIRVGPTGVVHVIGVKLTDHRRAAAEVVDHVVQDLRRDGISFERKAPTSKVPIV